MDDKQINNTKNVIEQDVNEVYTKIEQNQKKYLELMQGENAVKNAIKFNTKLNERREKLGIKTFVYTHKEDENNG